MANSASKSDSSNHGGMFNGADYHNAGGGSTSVPGTGMLGRQPVPKPTTAPVPNMKAPQQRPLGMSNMPFGANSVQPGTPLAQKTLMGVKTAANPAGTLPYWLQSVFKPYNLPWNVKNLTTNTTLGPLDPLKQNVITHAKNPTPQTDPTNIENLPSQSAALKRTAANLGVYAAARPAAESMTKRMVPKAMQIKAIGQAAPGAGRLASGLAKAKGGLLWDTPANAVLDALDYGGIYNVDGSKPLNAWQKPKLDAQGKPLANPDGSPQWEYGFNPGGFGANMKAHDESTTPSWTLGDMTTGNSAADAALSYGGSTWNAYQHPIKSTQSLANFSNTTFNPAGAMYNDYDKLKEMAAGKKVVNMNNASIPLTMANSLTNNASKPLFNPGSNLANTETAIHQKQDRYHPIYNRAGNIGRPNMVGRMWDRLWN